MLLKREYSIWIYLNIVQKEYLLKLMTGFFFSFYCYLGQVALTWNCNEDAWK